jgi:hypothetical protein
MKKIKAILKEGGGLVPETELPKENVRMIVCDGEHYIIFETGDQLPSDINPENVEQAVLDNENENDPLNP